MSRRYKQRGYQDDDGDREGRPRSSPGQPRERKEGPRGRGLGRPSESQFQCARCGERVRNEGAEVALDATCRKCGSDLHTCTNCRHFDTAARWQCRAEIEAPVPKKSAANECGLFEPKLVSTFKSDSGEPDDPRAAFDALFDL